MDLHFILQVFRVIELKLGPQLKDLINALSGRLLYQLLHPFTPIWLLMFLKTKQIEPDFQLFVSNPIM